MSINDTKKLAAINEFFARRYASGFGTAQEPVDKKLVAATKKALEKGQLWKSKTHVNPDNGMVIPMIPGAVFSFSGMPMIEPGEFVMVLGKARKGTVQALWLKENRTIGFDVSALAEGFEKVEAQ